MTICKTALEVAKVHRSYILLYLVGLSVIMTFFLTQSVPGVSGSKPVYAPLKSHVAVVDRDEDKGGVASGLREYLGRTNTVVRVDDDRRAIQDAMATDQADIVFVVPKGYMRDFAQAALSGQPPKQVDSVLRSRNDKHDLSEMKVLTFLSNLRTAYLAGGIAGGDAHDDTSGASSAGLPADGLSADTLSSADSANSKQTLQPDDESAMRRAVTDVLRATKTASEDAHVSVVATRHGSGNVSASRVFGLSLTLGNYPIVASTISIIALVVGAFTSESMRRRMEVSAERQQSVSFGLLAACAVIGLLVTVYYLVLSVGVTVWQTGSLAGLAWGPVVLATCSMAVYVCFGVSIGFVLGRLALSSRAVNGLANVVGLVIAATSGAWSFGTSVMTGPVALVGKLLCGRWYVDAIDQAMGLGAYAGSGSSIAGWFVSTGVVALFALTMVCVGLAVRPSVHKVVRNT